MKNLIVLICSFFVLHDVAGAERFFVNIKGSVAQIESVKKRSEYRMSKNVDFCRGVKMPKPVTGWRCSKRGTQAACTQEYECTFVDKNFNRKSESLRTYRAMKAVPTITTPYSIGLSAKPNLAPVKTKTVAARQVARPKVVATPIPTPAPLEADEDLLAEFEDVKPQEATQAEEKEDVFETAFSDEKPAEIEENKPESNEPGYTSTWDWLRFDGYFNQISDESGSQSVLEAGWRPRWKFSQRWSLEGRLGISQRKPIADTDEEAFSVMEMGVWLGRRLGNWNLSGGFGRQSWSGEGEFGEQTPTFLSAGVAYYWSDVMFLGIEAFEFQYLSISDEASSSAMRFGFLIDF